MFSAAGIFNLLVNLLHVVVPVIGIVVIAMKATDAPRKLGIAGCAILALAGLFQLLWYFIVPQIARGSGSSLTLILAIGGVVITLTSVLGLALVIGAVVSGRTGGRSGSPTQSGQPGQPGPNPYQQYPQGPSTGSGNQWGR